MICRLKLRPTFRYGEDYASFVLVQWDISWIQTTQQYTEYETTTTHNCSLGSEASNLNERVGGLKAKRRIGLSSSESDFPFSYEEAAALAVED